VARPEYWLRIKPWSLEAMLIALAALAAAVGMRVALAELGIPLYFATFLPAILATALLAGVPAGAFTGLSSAVIVWWAFLPPVFEFTMPTRAELHAITLFSLSTVLLIWFGHLCRTGLRMRKRKAA
jgi:H+/Cl- antiporter ClcA